MKLPPVFDDVPRLRVRDPLAHRLTCLALDPTFAPQHPGMDDLLARCAPANGVHRARVAAG
jgi:hypothetical protein